MKNRLIGNTSKIITVDYMAKVRRHYVLNDKPLKELKLYEWDLKKDSITYIQYDALPFEESAKNMVKEQIGESFLEITDMHITVYRADMGIVRDEEVAV